MALKPTIQIAVDDSAFKKFQAEVAAFTASLKPSGAGASSAPTPNGYIQPPGGYAPGLTTPGVYPPPPASPTPGYVPGLTTPHPSGASPGYAPGVTPGGATNIYMIIPGVTPGNASSGGSSLSTTLKNALTEALEPAKKLGEVFSSIANFTKDTTLFLLKWVGVAGVFSGLFGGLELMSLARLASNGLTSSRGLGVSQGELTAFKINYERYGLGEDTLKNISNNQRNYSSDVFRGLMQMGFTPGEIENGNPAQLAAQAASRAGDVYRRAGGSPQLLDAWGVTSVLGYEQLKTLANTPEAERNKQLKQFSLDSKRFDIDSGVAKLYQDFLQFLSEAGQSIKITLIDSLVGLTEPLSHLASAVADDINAFFGNGTVKEALKSIADGLEVFAKWIGSNDFKADMEGFVNGIKRFVEVLDWAYGKISYWVPEAAPVAIPDDSPTDTMRYRSYNGNLKGASNGNLKGASSGDGIRQWGINLGNQIGLANKFATLETQYELPHGLLWGTYGAESNFGKDLSTSEAGAMGAFQFLRSTGALYGLLSDSDFMDTEKSAKAAALYYAHLLKLKFINGDKRKAVAAYNWGEGNLEEDIRKHGSDWESFLPAETKGQLNKVFPYIDHSNLVLPPNGAPVSARDTNIRIVLENRTGASAAMSVQQLAVRA